MEILAFPYAYGSKNIYYELKNELGSRFGLHSFDYPAHGTRLGEKALCSISAIVDDAYEQIKEFISVPYCLLGYSMGGIVTFELYQKLMRENQPLPEHIFILASKELNWKYENYEYENFGLEEVKKVLREKNGTSEEILAENELIELISSAVKADSIALRDYSCDADKTIPVKCKVTIIRGSKEINVEHCKESWERYLKRECEYIIVNGDHFFLFNEEKDMTKKIANIISDRLSAISR